MFWHPLSPHPMRMPRTLEVDRAAGRDLIAASFRYHRRGDERADATQAGIGNVTRQGLQASVPSSVVTPPEQQP
jgi:hypothetical protein